MQKTCFTGWFDTGQYTVHEGGKQLCNIYVKTALVKRLEEEWGK